uniref:50S ribosomal protein L2 n=1 Tax=uncultured marine thaumarchaeote KM3_55_F05 TaxID=1456198 RepID=A0A075H8N1_9ARCH|nr:ribosomal protein L2 (RP-L2, rplB) [uncultured marine thaumarchaeote KM3_55_F05]
MGKRILVQRRGKGGMQWRAAKKGKIAPLLYPPLVRGKSLIGKITAILHERGRTAPVAKIHLDDGALVHLPATQGIHIGSQFRINPNNQAHSGDVLQLSQIPEGSTICNIEHRPGDGGKLVRAAGGYAILFARTPAGAIIRFRSGKSARFPGDCRATLGTIAGGGRTEKPFLKAGTARRLARARGRMYPRTRGVAMASVYHPFGGGRHQHPGKSTASSRNAPPGRKVGLIAPRKVGRGGSKRRFARTLMEK